MCSNFSVFRSVSLTNPTVRDQCQFRPGPEPCWESACWWSTILTQQNPAFPCWEIQPNLLQRYKHQQDMKKKKKKKKSTIHGNKSCMQSTKMTGTYNYHIVASLASESRERRWHVGRLLTCGMQIFLFLIFFFLPPQQNKSAECWQLITLEGCSIKAAISAREAQRDWQSDNVSLIIWTLFFARRNGRRSNVAFDLIPETRWYCDIKSPNMLKAADEMCSNRVWDYN